MSEQILEPRGCGERAEDGLYLTVGTSAFGSPIEFFLVDPAINWKGPQTLRAPMFIEDKQEVTHLLLGVGKQYYPFVPDFVEEARRLGVSKRVPRNIEVQRLSSQSKFLLMHPRAIPSFEYEASGVCPKRKLDTEPHECVGFLWSLSSLKDFGNVHSLNNGTSEATVIKTPSSWYEVTKPKKPASFIDEYRAGVFLAFPLRICNFEYVNKQGKVPPKLSEKIEKAGFKLDVVPQ